jgi:hypothetical protein
MMSNKTETKFVEFYVPTKPYGVIDAINRQAAATGSWNFAVSSSSADYNGHHISVTWNSYRGYYIAEYYWGQRNVLCRGTAAECVSAAINEWRHQGKGAKVSMTIKVEDADTIKAVLASFTASPTLAEVKEGREQWPPAWWSWKHAEVPNALNFERQLGCPYTSFLLKAETPEEYKALQDEFFKNRHAATTTLRS